MCRSKRVYSEVAARSFTMLSKIGASYYIALAVANIISFIAGTSLTWTSPMMLDLEHPDKTPFDTVLNPEQSSWISAMLPLGAIIGPHIFGYLAQKIGRKPTLFIAGVPFLVAYIVFAFAVYPWMYFVARFAVGMTVGGMFTVMPMYIAELAEDHNRGALSTAMNCFICFGFFFSHAVGSYMEIMRFNIILSVFPVIFLVLFPLLSSETPSYYLMKGKVDKAKARLVHIRKGKNEDDIEEEWNKLQEKAKTEVHGNLWDIFRHKGNRKAFITAMSLLGFQQFSGINAILFYAEDIFGEAQPSLEPQICSIIVGFTQFATSFWTPYIVDKLGRRILLVVSAIGIIIAEVPLGIYCLMKERGNIITFIGGTAITWSSPMLLDLEHPDQTPFDRVLEPEETSWISSVLPLGAVFGPYVFGFMAKTIGRKTTLMIAAVPFFLSFITLAIALYPWTYYVARFVKGMTIGGMFTVMPMYIAELAEDHNRGALGSSMNCFICLGFLFSHAVGSYLRPFPFNLILAVFPVIFIILFGLLSSESPVYYILKGHEEKAKKTLYEIRRGNEEGDIEKEWQHMQEMAKDITRGRMWNIFKEKSNRRAFVISMGLLAFQQVSGINAILFFAEDIFKHTGTTLSAEICSIIVGFTQFLSSFWTPFIVDKFGRRILLIISAIGIIIAEVPLGFYCHLDRGGTDVSKANMVPVVCLIWYILSFNTGVAILPWTIMGELFSPDVKTEGNSLVTSLTWLIGFVIAKYFQPLGDEIGLAIPFWFFSGCTALLIPFTLFFVIETKGKSLDEIQNMLKS
ncbi:hypothetical protein NQ315_011914 [Exocentrus adspersus]|uniref:Major facilitator superfamily (MFS) profile domain-containing protein n=1 Tax=Exocentrus adspersus TaxID=1586481 RepID=A0AAV8W179_9CUCU|nr:hypothetical protein NQ315_011914 [Exocentrus adspersus]